MWNPFKKAPAAEQVYRPVAGEVITLDDVPDPVFAGRSIGDGFAVLPTDGVFRAPVDGELALLAETLHAFAVRTDAGAEVLVHIGVDTVTLKGEGFTALATMGDRVRVGDPVIQVDLASVADKVPSMATPVIVTNGDEFSISAANLAAGADEPVATVQAV